MNELGKIRLLFIAFFTAIWAKLGVLAIPWLLLLVLNIIDYATGIAAAPYRDPEDERPVKSYKSIRGIQKKVCMHLLVVLGYVIDTLIKTSLANAGWGIAYPPIFAIAISLWESFNEDISILENISDVGTPIQKKVNEKMEQIGDDPNE